MNFILKIIVFAFFLYPFNMVVLAQNTIEWLEPFSGYGNNTVDDVTLSDNEDKLFVCGRFSETLSIENQNWIANNGKDIFLSALDTDGNILWNLIAESNFNDENARLTTYENAVYWTGAIWQNTIFADTSLTPTKNSKALFINRIHSTGEIEWSKMIEGSQTKSLQDIVANDQGIFIIGAFEDSLFIDDHVLLANAEQDFFLIHFSHNGNFIWAKQSGLSGNIHPKAMAINQNHIAITGTMFGSFDFGLDTIGNTTNDDDAFLALFDTNGQSIWAKRIGSTYTQQGSDVEFDTDGNIYCSGKFIGILPITTDLSIQTPNLYHNAYLIKYTPTGNALWGKSIGGDNFDQILSIDYDNDKLYCTGNYVNNFNFGNINLSGHIGYAPFIIAINSDNGIPLYHFPIQNNKDAIPSQIIAKNDAFFFSINSNDDISFSGESITITENDYDGVVGKWSTLTNVNNSDLTDIAIHPNPFNDFIQIETTEQIATVKLYTIDGRLIHNEKDLSIPTSHISKGTFILVVVLDNEKTYRKVIVKH